MTSRLGTILVQVDNGADARARVELALGLADRADSRLIGVASSRPTMPAYAPIAEGFVSVQAEVMKAVEAQIDRATRSAKSQFDDVVGTRGRVEWRTSLSELTEPFLLRQTRAADLVIVGRHGSADSFDPVLGIEPADVIMEAGRPVLVVPPQTRRLAAKRVIVAWKDVREARRAVADAIPLLQMADDVFVTALAPDSDEQSAGDVVAALAACGVNARALMENAGKLPAGDALIEIARRAGADLIVAGAFGHSRTREWIFGGVTRDLLDHAPVCCLLSH